MEENIPPKEYKYKLNADDFVKLFLASDEEFEELKMQLLGNIECGIKRINGYTQLADTEITSNITLNEEKNEKCSDLSCFNVKMKLFSISNTILKNGYYPTSFTFNNCKIEKASFKDSHTGDLNLWSSWVDYINIYSSNFGDLLLNEKTFVINEIRIYDSILEDLTIIESTTGKVFLNDSSTQDLNIFENSSIEGISIKASGTGEIRIRNAIINEFSTNFSITGDFSFTDVKINSFRTDYQYCSFSFAKSIISDLQFIKCNIPTFQIDSACDINGYIYGGYVNEINFRSTTIRSGSILSFSYSHVFSILAECFTMLGNLYFRKIYRAGEVFEYPTFEKMSIIESKGHFISEIREQRKRQYETRKEAYSERCKLFVEEPTIRISQSSLGKTEFTDCPLDKYQIEFSNSKITDCFVSGVSIPTDNVQIIGATEDSLEWHQQKASFYNQFKKIFEAQGDIYHATQFQAKWAEEEKKLLELIRKNEKGWFTTTFSDLWVLRLNKWSNLHGESWPLAFAFLLGTGLFFYLLYLLTISKLFNGNEIDFNLIGYYFEFLNPAHKLNFIEGNEKINGWTVFVDYFGRVVIAFGIYQFIAAFRKHTKKQ